MKTKHNDSAFPLYSDLLPIYGLTKREYFAALAMQGLLSCDTDAKHAENAVACFAVTHADSLIKELNK